jgi:hypothetical protein
MRNMNKLELGKNRSKFKIFSYLLPDLPNRLPTFRIGFSCAIHYFLKFLLLNSKIYPFWRQKTNFEVKICTSKKTCPYVEHKETFIVTISDVVLPPKIICLCEFTQFFHNNNLTTMQSFGPANIRY